CDDTGRHRGFAKVCRDSTVRRVADQALAKTTQELARSNAELEQFAYVASHDLKEPLRTASSYIQLLARRYRGQLDASADDFIGYAVDAIARMEHLIQDVLAHSQAGAYGKEFHPVECVAAVNRALENLKTII